VDKKGFALILQLHFSVADPGKSKAPPLLTLHERILQREMKTKYPQKPPLGARFEIALLVAVSFKYLRLSMAS
jgi:hypothetical protein